MSRRKIIDLPLLEQFGRTAVRPLGLDLSTTKDRVTVLENAIPTKINTILFAEDWEDDVYSFQETYPSASMTIDYVGFSGDVTDGQYVVLNDSLEEGGLYRLYDTEGNALQMWMEIQPVDETDPEEHPEGVYSVNVYDTFERIALLGVGTAAIVSRGQSYDIDIYLDEVNASRAQRDAFVDATLTAHGTSNKILALDGAPTVDIPIILEVVMTDGGEDS